MRMRNFAAVVGQQAGKARADSKPLGGGGHEKKMN